MEQKIYLLKSKSFLNIVLASVLSLLVSSQASASVEDPQELIATNTKKLLLELREKKELIKSNEKVAYDLGNDLVVPYLDFPRITRLVIGKHWRSANKSQKEQLVTEVRLMLIRSYVTVMRTYADHIANTGHSISYLPSRFKAGDKKAAVRAVITMDDSSTIDVQYMLYKNKEDWKVYDIRVGGISLAVTYRTSFNSEIQSNGLDGLIAKLSEQNSKGVVDFPGGTNQSVPNALGPR